MAKLTESQLAQYRNQGFTVVEDLYTTAECDEIIERAYDIVSGRISSNEGVALEPSAVELGLVGDDNKPDYLFKLGHSMHLTDDIFQQYARDERIAGILRQLLGPGAVCMQTMFIDKAPNIGVGQPYHQDAHYLRFKPDTLMAAWIACDDVDEENGCLHVVPGSQDDPIHPHGVPRDPAQKIYHEVYSAQSRAEVPVPLKKGSAVFFTGHVLHRSGNNYTNRRRRAYVLHYVDANSRWFDSITGEERFDETLPVFEQGVGELQRSL